MKQSAIETRMGTWGVVLKPNKRATVVFEQPFHLKTAVLDFNGFAKQDSHFRVVLTDNTDSSASPLTICLLNKPNNLQTSLNLHFEPGDDVTFAVKTTDLHPVDVNGFSVHLSGTTDRYPDAFVPANPQRRRLLTDKQEEIKAVEKGRSASNPFVGSERKIEDGFPRMEMACSSVPNTPFEKTPSTIVEPTISSTKVDKRTENWEENGNVKGKRGFIANSEKIVDLCKRQWKNLSTSSTC